MPTAILVDGAYFIKRFRRIEPDNAYDVGRAADCLHRWTVMHLHDGNGKRSHHCNHHRDLYRIFCYDRHPLVKKMHNPITKTTIDFSQTSESRFRAGKNRGSALNKSFLDFHVNPSFLL